MKKWQIVFLMIGTVFLAGCGKKPAKPEASSKIENQAKARVKNDKKEGVVNSIKKAMNLGKPMKCVYEISDDASNTKVTTYVKGKKYATKVAVDGKIIRMVFDGKAMYSWREGEREGTKMTDSCMQSMNTNFAEKNNGETDSIESRQEKEFDKAVNVNCTEFKGVDFSIPNNVVFSDPCKSLEQMKKNIPAEVDIPVSLQP